VKSPALPKSIRVGHRDVSIVLVDGDDLDGAFGDYLASKQRIRINSGHMPQTQASTLIHELLHACWPVGPRPVTNVEESFVTSLEPMLASVWRDNPALVAWISFNLGAR
jgi:IrrE N-terminal-like domain